MIPVDKRVRFLVTSNDVIHSWWVPDFAVKKDAIPGFVHESWAVVKEPEFTAANAELCGKDHGFMPIVVHAVEQDEYDDWVAMKQEEALQVYETVGKTWTMAELWTRVRRFISKIACLATRRMARDSPSIPIT